MDGKSLGALINATQQWAYLCGSGAIAVQGGGENPQQREKQ